MNRSVTSGGPGFTAHRERTVTAGFTYRGSCAAECAPSEQTDCSEVYE